MLDLRVISFNFFLKSTLRFTHSSGKNFHTKSSVRYCKQDHVWRCLGTRVRLRFTEFRDRDLRKTKIKYGFGKDMSRASETQMAQHLPLKLHPQVPQRRRIPVPTQFASDFLLCTVACAYTTRTHTRTHTRGGVKQQNKVPKIQDIL